MKSQTLREETKERIIKQLESMPFEEARNKVLLGKLGYDFESASHNFCLSWLLNKESQIRAEESKERDAREASTLDIAKSAKKLTSRQLRYAIYATIIALIATIITAKPWILESIKLIKSFIYAPR